ncbi:hypothetical protein SRCM101294_00263 [Bacillus amyloliquefaciens]|nr:hypothetical protein SRCM101294_00263 [Bacillus amyloliquefaciens]
MKKLSLSITVTYGLKAFTDLNMMSRMKIGEPDT